MNPYTTDTFFNGKIRVKQSRGGYRFSIDAVLLAYHARPRPGERVVDLGTGCGIIPLILAYWQPDIDIYGVEVQPELAQLAVFNVSDNRLGDRIAVLCTDMKLLKPAMTSGPVELVVCNPPFRTPGSGRMNPDRQRAIARHEIRANLADIIQTSRRLLLTGGRLVLIYPVARMTDILFQMRTQGIEPKCARMIHSRRSAEAALVIIEGVKGGRPGLKVEPPLIIYNSQNGYTTEIEAMFKG